MHAGLFVVFFCFFYKLFNKKFDTTKKKKKKKQKGIHSASDEEMMTPEEFTAWFLKHRGMELQTNDSTQPAEKPNTPPAAGTDLDNQNPPDNNESEEAARRRHSIFRHIWNLIKCLFLTFLLAYDGSKASSNFIIGALILFFINVIQNGNLLDQIVVVRHQEAPVAPPPQVEAPPQTNAADGDADTDAQQDVTATPVPPPQVVVAQRPPVGKIQLTIRVFAVFVESLLPSWTLRELDRYN